MDESNETLMTGKVNTETPSEETKVSTPAEGTEQKATEVPGADSELPAGGLPPKEGDKADDKTEEEKAKEGSETEKKPGEEGDKEKEPGKYKEFTTLEGYSIPEEDRSSFEKVASEAGLDQEGAQGFVTLFGDVIKRRDDADAQAAADVEKGWLEALKTHPEYGGAKLEENLAIASKALSALGSPELVEYLNTSRGGNNPHLIALLYKAGKLISEDNFKEGAPAEEVKGNKTKENEEILPQGKFK